MARDSAKSGTYSQFIKLRSHPRLGSHGTYRPSLMRTIPRSRCLTEARIVHQRVQLSLAGRGRRAGPGARAVAGRKEHRVHAATHGVLGCYRGPTPVSPLPAVRHSDGFTIGLTVWARHAPLNGWPGRSRSNTGATPSSTPHTRYCRTPRSPDRPRCSGCRAAPISPFASGGPADVPRSVQARTVKGLAADPSFENRILRLCSQDTP